MITRMALRQMILYNSWKRMKNLFLRLHVLVNKVVMKTKLGFAALQKMKRWWMMCTMREPTAKQSEEKILLEMGTKQVGYWIHM